MRVVAVMLMFALTPGIAEAAEDFGHLLAEGHTLHDPVSAHAEHEGHDEHEEQHGDDEHGCSVLFHLCGCHSTAPSVVTMTIDFQRARDLQAEVLRVLYDDTRRPLDDVHGEAFRPPIV